MTGRTDPETMDPDELRAARRRMGMTQRQLADAIGYQDSVSISRMERGVSPISRAVALAVRHLCDCLYISGTSTTSR